MVRVADERGGRGGRKILIAEEGERRGVRGEGKGGGGHEAEMGGEREVERRRAGGIRSE